MVTKKKHFWIIFNDKIVATALFSNFSGSTPGDRRLCSKKYYREPKRSLVSETARKRL